MGLPLVTLERYRHSTLANTDLHNGRAKQSKAEQRENLRKKGEEATKPPTPMMLRTCHNERIHAHLVQQPRDSETRLKVVLQGRCDALLQVLSIRGRGRTYHQPCRLFRDLVSHLCSYEDALLGGQRSLYLCHTQI